MRAGWRGRGARELRGPVATACLLRLAGRVVHIPARVCTHAQVQMTTTDWDECGYWLSAVKRLIKMQMQGM